MLLTSVYNFFVWADVFKSNKSGMDLQGPMIMFYLFEELPVFSKAATLFLLHQTLA